MYINIFDTPCAWIFSCSYSSIDV